MRAKVWDFHSLLPASDSTNRMQKKHGEKPKVAVLPNAELRISKRHEGKLRTRFL